MATSSSGRSTDKIIVKGIPPNINSDKLTIYFQRRKIGGGDVASVTFPVSTKEPDTAIITFEEPETVVSVLRNSHKIGGKDVVVTTVQPQPKIFEIISAQISDYVIQQIKSKNEDVDAILTSISDSTGCAINEGGETYKVEGEWYQIQAAFERFEAIVSESLGSSSSPPPNGYLSRTLTQSTITGGPPPYGVPVIAPGTQRTPVKKEVVSTMIDKDIYAYMEMVHLNRLQGLKSQFHVDFSCKIIGDAAKVEVMPQAHDADPEKAAKALESFSQEVSNSSSQDTIELDSKYPPGTAEKIFVNLRPEFPKVHMDTVHSSPNIIIFMAPDADSCRMAKDMAKHFLQREEIEQGAAGDAGKKNEVCADKDILAFMILTRKVALDSLWDRNGAKISSNTIDDCVTITIQPKGSSTLFNLENAINEFQTLYNYVNTNAQQDNYQLPRNFSDNKVYDAIRLTQGVHKDVHVARMIMDPNQVLFIADTNVKCRTAMTMFDRLIKGQK